MCGRYVLSTPFDAVASVLRIAAAPGDLPLFPPRYNIAPSQQVAIVRSVAQGRGNELAVVRWGFVPFWSKTGGAGDGPPPPINARSETVDTKPMFREAFKHRRCLIPADGFYEWKVAPEGGKGKRPYLVTSRSGLFAMAGLWERWTPPDGGDPLETCVILTTPPNPFLSSLHDRMPAILPRRDWDAWLDLATEPAAAKALLRPLADGPDGDLEMRPVSRRVNSPRNDDAACIAPPEADPAPTASVPLKRARSGRDAGSGSLFGGDGGGA
ncbi:MAG: SOS response-associated peptidase [Phycisphaeraceae bacterium]|nr:SOS response-associated peptidase [Phycisphaeraceae bacterium]MBX3407118.1 SOS response-associated peptidase [Phycisphaeraceae bacterium]